MSRGGGTGFAERYGPWAVVAGASEGIGAAFARHLYAQGLGVVLVGRRRDALAAFSAALLASGSPASGSPAPGSPVGAAAGAGARAQDPVWIRDSHVILGQDSGDLPDPNGILEGVPGARVRVVAADLATEDGLASLFAATAGLSVGLVVANAALSPIGPFVRAPEDGLLRALDLNARAPLRLARHYLPAMAERRRGGFVVMSSLAGQQGSPGLAAYAGTKAFGAVLAESLWAELRPSGVDVLACVAGAVATPGLAQSTTKRAPGTVSPETVVAAAFRALGKRPVTVPGGLMRWSAAFMRRVLPRRTAVTIMGNASKDILA